MFFFLRFLYPRDPSLHRMNLSLRYFYGFKNIYLSSLYGKNDFAEVSKNLARYRSENNFVELSKSLCRTLKHNEQYCKKF